MRVSIAEIMAAILLIGADVRAVRSILGQEGGPTDALLSSAGMVVLTVLGAGLFVLRRRWRRGEASPSLLAFEVAGGFLLLVYVVAAVFVPDVLLGHFKWAWSGYIRYMAASSLGMTGSFIYTVELAMMAHFSAILLIPAAIAGLVARARRARDAGGRLSCLRPWNCPTTSPRP